MGEISRLLSELEAAIDKIPPSEEQRMARTRLAECGFWLGKCEMLEVPGPIHPVDLPAQMPFVDGVVRTGETEPFFSGFPKMIVSWIVSNSYEGDDRYQIRVGATNVIMTIGEYLARVKTRLSE